MIKRNVWKHMTKTLRGYSYGRTSQHNKGLYSYRMKYRTHCNAHRTVASRPSDVDQWTHSCHALEQRSAVRPKIYKNFRHYSLNYTKTFGSTA